MVGACRRLFVAFKSSDAFEFLAACDNGYDKEKLESLAGRLNAKRAACEECIVQDFTIEMLGLMETDPEGVCANLC